MAEEKFSKIDQKLAIYFVISCIIALLMAIKLDRMEVDGVYHHFNFFTRFFIFIFSMPGGVIGLRIGEWVRDMLKPDFQDFAEGFFGAIKESIFWAVGPQFIGLVVGMAVTAYPVLLIALSFKD